ncbi:MAG TPA: hypothetical protein VGC38_09355 [Pseudolabrys sp.]
MAGEQVAVLLAAELERQNYPIQDREVLSGLAKIVDSFDTDALIEANKRSDGELFRLFSELTIEASSYRREKFSEQHNKIALSDFVPAFLLVGIGYESPDFPSWPPIRFERRRRTFGLVARESWQLIRKSCPWC